MVEIENYLLNDDGSYTPLEQVESYDGNTHHVKGSVTLTVDGVEVLPQSLWDDIDWIWPGLVVAVQECKQTGQGRCPYPSQPINLLLEILGLPAGQLKLSLFIPNGNLVAEAVGSAEEIYQAIAEAGLIAFRELDRLTGLRDSQFIEIIEGWETPS